MRPLPMEIKITIIIAIMLMVIIVVFLVLITILYNRRQILFNKEKRLETMEYNTQLLQTEIDFQKRAKEEQERLSHDMHDDLGAGISAIKLQAEFIKRKTTDPEIAENVDDLLQACADLSNSLREVLWNIKPGSDSLKEFTERIIHYAHTFFSKSAIRVFTEQNNIGFELIPADSRRNIFMCVKEILNNIYKHSRCRNVTLHFNQTLRTYSIDIKDDGIGLTEDTEYGNGLDNIKCRMESIDGFFRFLPVDKGLHLCLSVTIAPVEEEKA